MKPAPCRAGRVRTRCRERQQLPMQNLNEQTQRSKSTTKAPLFVLLPSKVVQHPPIHHRHDQHGAGVEPFAFAIGCAAMALAYPQLTADHALKLAAGAAAGEQEKAYAEQYDREVKAWKRTRRR